MTTGIQDEEPYITKRTLTVSTLQNISGTPFHSQEGLTVSEPGFESVEKRASNKKFALDLMKIRQSIERSTTQRSPRSPHKTLSSSRCELNKIQGVALTARSGLDQPDSGRNLYTERLREIDENNQNLKKGYKDMREKMDKLMNEHRIDGRKSLVLPIRMVERRATEASLAKLSVQTIFIKQ